MYYVTRDGFAFLAMGFTGKKAAQFKERYIAAFNAMEKKLMGDMREMLSKEDGMKMSDPAEENSPTLAQKLTSIKVSKV
jgi:phage regulator Rha-like protein